jgi:putative tryptophan/tyrosine transport system substrate-binding protein
MKRREFITLLAGAAAMPFVLWPLAARAQPSGKIYRIGFLGVTSHGEYSDRVEAVRTGLRQLGYEESKNLVIHYRWAEGRYERLPELAAELVQLNVDVIVTHSTPGSRAAKQATSTIPIVANSGDPVEAGLVGSLARPGGNLTGTTFFFDEICAKRVELIKEAIPTLTRLAVLVNPANASNRIALSAMQRTAGWLGVELLPVEVKARDDIAAAPAMVTGQQASALLVVEDPVSISSDRWTAELMLQNKLPMIGFKPHAKAGALMDYGVDVTDQFYRLAAFVDRILKGTPPADLPIERAVKFDLVVNLKSAKALGIELPTSLLIRADEVIE